MHRVPADRTLRYCSATEPVPPFHVEIVSDEDGPVVRVRGAIDLATADELRASLEVVVAARHRPVLDLGGVTFMGSAGLHLVVDAYRELGRDGSSVVIRNPRPSVARVFHLSAVDRLVTVEGGTG